MSIKVITPGMLSTIQDGGRKGFAGVVPISLQPPGEERG